MDRLDDAVRRILRVKFEMGLFERPMPAMRSVGGRIRGEPGARRRRRGEVRGAAEDEPGALPVGTGTTRAAGRIRCRRHRYPVRRLVDHVAGRHRADDGGHHPRGRRSRSGSGPADLRCGGRVSGGDPGTRRSRRGCGAALCRGSRRLGDAPAALVGPGRCRPDAPAGRPPRGRDLQRATDDARTDSRRPMPSSPPGCPGPKPKALRTCSSASNRSPGRRPTRGRSPRKTQPDPGAGRATEPSTRSDSG